MSKANTISNLKFYTTSEIAQMLKMNVQVIARKLQKGEIPGYKIGKDWRISEDGLMQWLGKHSNENAMNPGEQIIARFTRAGKIKALPVRRKKRRYVLEYLLKKFELNRVYSEKEINDIIYEYYDDFCTVRREFIMEKMMSRFEGKYRRNNSYIFQK